MDPSQLYNGHAAAVQKGRPAFDRNPRNDQIAAWAHQFLTSRGRRSVDLVELAIGDGGLSFALARHLPHARVLGVDISTARIDNARAAAMEAGLQGRMTFRALDVERELSDLPNASADALFAIDVLEHLFDVFGFVSHLSRVVRPGGLVVLRVPNIAYVRHRVALALGKLPVTASWFGPVGSLDAWKSTWGWDGGHLHYFTRSTLSDLFSMVGLAVIEWRDPGSSFEAVRRVMPDLLIGNLCLFAQRVEKLRPTRVAGLTAVRGDP